MSWINKSIQDARERRELKESIQNSTRPTLNNAQLEIKQLLEPYANGFNELGHEIHKERGEIFTIVFREFSPLIHDLRNRAVFKGVNVLMREEGGDFNPDRGWSHYYLVTGYSFTCSATTREKSIKMATACLTLSTANQPLYILDRWSYSSVERLQKALGRWIGDFCYDNNIS